MKHSGKQQVVFFGSGPVAAQSLQLLLHNFDVELVITKPRAKHHKGPVPVLEVAEAHDLPVLTANNRQELDELVSSHQFTSRVAVLIDFGIIVSKKVIDTFELGIVNSHFSLLPKLRGADPITFAILNGDHKTGVSLMLLDEGMDTGMLITQKTFHLSADMTTPTLTQHLIRLSNELLTDYLPRYINGSVVPRRQPHPDRATYTRKLTKSDGIIDWHKPAPQIEREVRAFIGWPGSRTALFGKDVIITKAHVLEQNNSSKKPGDLEVNKQSNLLAVTTLEGALVIENLKPAGKREMSSKDFISGYYKS